jgi:hypothetical protein
MHAVWPIFAFAEQESRHGFIFGQVGCKTERKST